MPRRIVVAVVRGLETGGPVCPKLRLAFQWSHNPFPEPELEGVVFVDLDVCDYAPKHSGFLMLAKAYKSAKAGTDILGELAG